MSASNKSTAIDILEVAEANLLHSFLGVRPEDIHKQTHPEFNNIMWILGHCIVHFHMVLCGTCQDVEMLSDDIGHFFRFGTTKEEIAQTGAPLTFSRLIDEYLRISASGFTYLHSLEDEDFEKVIFPEYEETLLQSILRIALHYMGHVGQIVMIRRALGNPGPTFVGGVSQIGRENIKQKWNKWWSETKENFEL